jgi:hypothetical protein
MLLGHTSIKITERHYSPWDKARQEQLEADVRRTWNNDPATGTLGDRQRFRGSHIQLGQPQNLKKASPGP